MKRINNILYRDLVIFVSISMMIIGCTTSSHIAKSIENPKIRNLKYYKEVSVYKRKHTKIKVKEGETIILTPLYPKGFIYAVRGRIGDEGEPFDALDVDSGEIHQAKASGILQIGYFNIQAQ